MNPGETFAFMMVNLVLIAFIIAVAITRRNALKARHVERMTMIEKGMHPDQVPSEKNVSFNVPRWMKIGSTVTGIGAGFVVGALMADFFHVQEEPILMGSVLFLGGAGLSLPYFLLAYFRTHGDKYGEK